MVHCSGGAQTKVLHFVDDVHVIKDNLFSIPPLFSLIQEQSGTDWKEMYKVFCVIYLILILVLEVFPTEKAKYLINARMLMRI